MADDIDTDHQIRDFEPHERRALRDMLRAWCRGQWLRSLIVKFLGYAVLVLTVIAALRSEIEAVVKYLFGGSGP